MEVPAGLTPEAAAWMQAQIAMANAQSAAILRCELSKVDDWANGIFAAVRDLLLHQLEADPGLAAALAPEWRKVAEDFDRIDVQGLPAAPNEPLEFLEARKMLYRLSSVLGLMPTGVEVVSRQRVR